MADPNPNPHPNPNPNPNPSPDPTPNPNLAAGGRGPEEEPVHERPDHLAAVALEHVRQRPELARRLSRAFTVLFLAMRLGVFPAFCTRYVQSVYSGEMGTMVRSERLVRLWAVVNVAAVLGGVVWSKALIQGYIADTRKSRQ